MGKELPTPPIGSKKDEESGTERFTDKKESVIHGDFSTSHIKEGSHSLENTISGIEATIRLGRDVVHKLRNR